MRSTLRFMLENSLFLIFGSVAALAWANFDLASYEHLLHLELFHSSFIGHVHGDSRVVSLHFLVNDILMALFFAIAGKEVWEATLPNGPLSDPRKAAAPLIATLGGMGGPALVYLGVAFAFGELSELGRGWAIPTATDIAFSYLVARIIFGAGHPAIPFLLLLAIADDALGLVIIAAFYPQGPINLVWMLLPVAAFLIGTGFRRARISSFWPYLLICGPISWLGFHWANLHPALGLLPIIPAMPHAHMDTGLFDWSGLDQTDTLNSFEHWWKNPVEIVLGLFGLMNAGVAFASVGTATVAVLAGLLVGKPLGIWLMGALAERLGFALPAGFTKRDLLVVGCVAAIGFTVSIFVSSVAFPPGSVQDAAKIGALASFGAAIVSVVMARVMRVQKVAAPAAVAAAGSKHGN